MSTLALLSEAERKLPHVKYILTGEGGWVLIFKLFQVHFVIC